MKICIICNHTFNKGIGICCSRQCHNIRINSRSRENDKHVVAKLNKIAVYEADPNYCKFCKTALPWMKRKNLFCNQSCSAKIANTNRSRESRNQQVNTLRERLAQNSNIKFAHCKVTFKSCIVCTQAFRAVKGKSKYCSLQCFGSASIKKYRNACKFKISKTLYPFLFDNDLLVRYGWYRASNHPKGHNPKGATWDHLFRIEDGFKLGVDPIIMSHPANAEMVSWEENFSRKRSKISYDELLSRIRLFESTQAADMLRTPGISKSRPAG